MKNYIRDNKGRFTSKVVESAKDLLKEIKDFKSKDVVRFFVHSLEGVFKDRDLGRYFLVANYNLSRFQIFSPLRQLVRDPNCSESYCTNLISSGIWVEASPNSIIVKETCEKYDIEVPNSWVKLLELKNKKYIVKEDSTNVIGSYPKETKKLELSDIKIGSLYYCLNDESVVRVVDVQGRLVYCSYHKGVAEPYGVSSLRKATKQEVEDYLRDAES